MTHHRSSRGVTNYELQNSVEKDLNVELLGFVLIEGNNGTRYEETKAQH